MCFFRTPHALANSASSPPTLVLRVTCTGNVTRMGFTGTAQYLHGTVALEHKDFRYWSDEVVLHAKLATCRGI